MKKRRFKINKDQSDYEPIVIHVNPRDIEGCLQIPKITYRVMRTMKPENVFTGMIIPMPRVLIYYLNHTELMIMSAILEDTLEFGECNATITEFATKYKMAVPTISNALYSLRLAGLIVETPNGRKGCGRNRKINFKAIQHLNDLVLGENPDVYYRIRKATRKRAIINLTKKDIHNAYDNKILAPDHDPAEEEEYD